VKVETLFTNGTDFDEATAGKYFSSGSKWILEEADGDTTRLISRWRTDYSRDSLGNRLSYSPWFVEPVGFVMSRKMLRGIKRRAESFASEKLKIRT
jgi:hypothetical protein